MNNLILQISITLILLVSLFFLSRFTTNHLFYFFRRFIKNEKLIFNIISLIFFPGTVIHELAHFFAATILFLRVRDIKIFPEWEGNNLKLGRVLYEKKDFIRGFLVGIAPIFVALLIFLAIFAWRLFPNQNFLINVFIVYLTFAISSTMFSSKQDLIDFIYIPPILILIAGIVYVFDIKIAMIFHSENIKQLILSFLTQINYFLLLSIAVHIGMIILLKILLRRRRS